MVIGRILALLAGGSVACAAADVAVAGSIAQYVTDYELTARQVAAITAASAAGTPLAGLDIQVVRVSSPRAGDEWIWRNQVVTTRSHGGGRVAVTVFELGLAPTTALMFYGDPIDAFPDPGSIRRKVCYDGRRLSLDCPPSARPVGRVFSWTFPWHPNTEFNTILFNEATHTMKTDTITIR